MSIQDVRPNPQDTTAFYLANIYRVLADPNRSNFSLPSSPPTFSPPTYAVWVNALWFLSLVISLTCALLATLLQQWARSYNTATQPRLNAHTRVQIHAFFSEGVEKFLLPWAVEALPMLLHLSLYLFFAGLLVFTWNINHTIFRLALSWVGICTALYGCITIMPIIRHNSPYHTPLSSLAWFVSVGVPFVILQVIRWLGRRFFSRETSRRLRDMQNNYHKSLSLGMRKTAEETARNLPLQIDPLTFMRTFESLNDDDELERFFAGLPGFRNSRVVSDPLPILTQVQKLRLSAELLELMDRTLSSDLLPEPVKTRRAIICAKAIDPAHFSGAVQWMLDKVTSEDWYGPLLTAEVGHIVKGWGNSGDRSTALLVKAMVSSIVARAPRSNDRWFTLASNELGVPKSVLRDYAAQGDSLSLAILIHVTRQHFRFSYGPSWPPEFSLTLEAISEFNVRDTSPKLQHDFCVLWNEVVSNFSISGHILGHIRHIYIALHNTDAVPSRFSTSDYDDILREPSSYPVCNVPDHHPDLTTHIYEDIDFTTFAPDFSLHALPKSAGSSSVPTHVPANGRSMGVPPADNNISSPITAPSHHITVGDSSNSAATGATLGNDTDAIMARSATQTSTSTRLIASTSPPGAVDHQPNADLRVSSSDGSNILRSSPIPVFGDMPLAGPQLSSDPHATRSDHAPSGPESSPLIPAAALSQLNSEPDWGAVAEGEGSTRAAFREDKSASGPPLIS